MAALRRVSLDSYTLTVKGRHEPLRSRFIDQPLVISTHQNHAHSLKRRATLRQCCGEHNWAKVATRGDQGVRARLQTPQSYRGRSFLDAFKIPIELQLQYERKGHVCLRQLFCAQEMNELVGSLAAEAQERELEAFRHRLTVLCPDLDSLSCTSVRHAEQLLQEKGSEEVGFLQIFNLHRTNAVVRHLCTSPRLAKAAADILGCKKVRLYSDVLFLKHPGFGCTNWHSDLNMVPLDTNDFATFWIPMQTLEEQDSRLFFASGSHRDFSLPYWQSNEGMEDLMDRGYPLGSYQHIRLGDATVHAGWTLHWAPEQPKDRPTRMALAVSYFADGARVLQTKRARRTPHSEDALSFQGWRSRLKEGQVARDTLLPLVYPPTPRGK